MNTVRVIGFVGAALATLHGGTIFSAQAAHAADCYEKAPLRPIHRTFVRRDIEEPGLYEVTRRPSQYGTYTRKIIKSRETVWHETPAIYRSMSKRVRVSGGWTWAKKEIAGKEIMCRVRIPDRYETVEKQVLVRPARRWSEYKQKVGYVHERILLRPYRNIASYHPPHIRNYRERLRIHPEGYRWKPTRLRSDC